jgi:hypothetical protein
MADNAPPPAVKPEDGAGGSGAAAGGGGDEAFITIKVQTQVRCAVGVCACLVVVDTGEPLLRWCSGRSPPIGRCFL